MNPPAVDQGEVSAVGQNLQETTRTTSWIRETRDTTFVLAISESNSIPSIGIGCQVITTSTTIATGEDGHHEALRWAQGG